MLFSKGPNKYVVTVEREKLKMVDLSASETRTIFEDQKRIVLELQETGNRSLIGLSLSQDFPSLTLKFFY